MSDPRGIIGVPEVSNSVQASARIEALGGRGRRPQDEMPGGKKRKKKRRLPELPEDGEPHVDLLA